MPDLKFRDAKFYFSILNPSGGFSPLLIPRITNPDFATTDRVPGIVQLIEGDLGITEQIMTPILEPIISTFLENPLLTEAIANVNNLEETNSEAITSVIVKNYIPEDTGLKALEKTIITTMMEGYKPLMDFLKIFIEMLGVAEDVFCRFLGTSIKVLGKEIGFPSRSPIHWGEEFNYAETINHALQKFLEASQVGEDEFLKSMSDNNPIKENVPGGGGEKVQGNADQEAYYVGYFDEIGNSVEPPKWILDSGKWFSREAPDANGNLQILSSPFEQLSPVMEEGVADLRGTQQIQLDNLDRDKNNMVQGIEQRIKEAEKITNPVLKKQEIDSLNAEKEEAITIFDGLKTTIQDLLDGTNKGGANFIDPEDTSKGINPPASLAEWIGKVKGAQLRQKYFPEQETTVQRIIDKKGKPKEPYARIPKVRVQYNGRNVGIEAPLAYPSQISKQKVVSSNTFFDRVRRHSFDEDRLRRRYSNINKVSSLNIYEGTDRDLPYEENSKTYFNNDAELEYIPDNVKNYYLPLEWEEVLEFELRDKRTQKVLRTETEVIPFKIDIENDYELRVIKVVNKPLEENGVNNDFFSEENIDIVNQETFIVNESTSFIDGTAFINASTSFINITSAGTNFTTIETGVTSSVIADTRLNRIDSFFSPKNLGFIRALEPDTETGTLFAQSNDIPDKYNFEDPDLTEHSTPDINENNLLKEGIIYQGLDPRFVDRDRWKVFWLVEAIKKDSRDIAPINNKFNPNELNDANNDSNDPRGKQWYGLLDKFTALPQVIIRLVPLITSKLIPMIVKIIQLISNPTKIKDFMLEVGLTDESVSKFPQIFKDYSSESLEEIQNLDPNSIPKNLDEQETTGDLSTNATYMGLQEGVDNPQPISSIDGQALAEFGKGAFGRSIVDIGIELEGGNYKTITEKEVQTDFNSPAPKKEQSLFTFILNTIKLPFEIIFKIFKWIIDWIKKLLNPVNIPSAIAEFLSFKWLLEILGKDSIFGILGLVDLDTDAITKDISGEKGQDLFDRTLDALRGGDQRFVEVLIYDILVNGRKVRQETEERPYTGNDAQGDGLLGDIPEEGDNRTGLNGGIDPDDPLGFCGIRFFNIKDIFPIPFLPDMPAYNACEVPQVFLKPLEMVVGFLKFLQGIINGCIGMPSAILGLEPTISLPKFGEEIPFANVLEDFLEGLKERLTRIDTDL